MVLVSGKDHLQAEANYVAEFNSECAVTDCPSCWLISN